MRVTGVLLAAGSLISGAAAFRDSAPFLFGWPAVEELSYLTPFADIKAKSHILSSNICSTDDKLVIVTIPGLSKDLLNDGYLDTISDFIQSKQNEGAKYTPHVRYARNEDSSLSAHESCTVDNIDVVKDENWLSRMEEAQAQAIFLKFPEEVSKINEYFEQLTLILSSKHKVIVQGLPTFAEPTVPAIQKRDDTVSEEDYNKIQQELDQAFQEIEDMIESENSDKPISIYEKSVSAAFNTTDGSLFDKYSYFTPGIWMCTLVSLFLVFVFGVALNWLSSLQVSYRAFDKPFNARKKTQ
ncbi:unnamed protein product [Kuraishia capsulata CBS 1993]|uniref:Protein BIG1 n=1 Tax=Kuraishia capsulata CBS 1993 TaxID=1382522 RepID=W6MX71_9ASCO|nr:uncharacterized protein KUCA_T00004362001 [Kuraishia capsulata CBS 1993]CDK28380.1 unnamed protein product [Kuraishia capsulata CBS 1993]